MYCKKIARYFLSRLDIYEYKIDSGFKILKPRNNYITENLVNQVKNILSNFNTK